MTNLPHLTLTLSPPAGSGEGTAVADLLLFVNAPRESSNGFASAGGYYKLNSI
jgi:hypothetical protein